MANKSKFKGFKRGKVVLCCGNDGKFGWIHIIAWFIRVYYSYDFFWPSGGMYNLAGIGAKNLKFCEPHSRDSLVFDQ